jgi:hypothetical protein
LKAKVRSSSVCAIVTAITGGRNNDVSLRFLGETLG